MPVVPASDWVKAQKLSEDGVFKCTFRLKGSYIVPPSHLLRNLPSTCKTPEAEPYTLRCVSCNRTTLTVAGGVVLAQVAYEEDQNRDLL